MFLLCLKQSHINTIVSVAQTGFKVYLGKCYHLPYCKLQYFPISKNLGFSRINSTISYNRVFCQKCRIETYPSSKHIESIIPYCGRDSAHGPRATGHELVWGELWVWLPGGVALPRTSCVAGDFSQPVRLLRRQCSGRVRSGQTFF